MLYKWLNSLTILGSWYNSSTVLSMVVDQPKRSPLFSGLVVEYAATRGGFPNLASS